MLPGGVCGSSHRCADKTKDHVDIGRILVPEYSKSSISLGLQLGLQDYSSSRSRRLMQAAPT